MPPLSPISFIFIQFWEIFAGNNRFITPIFGFTPLRGNPGSGTARLASIIIDLLSIYIGKIVSIPNPYKSKLCSFDAVFGTFWRNIRLIALFKGRYTYPFGKCGNPGSSVDLGKEIKGS